MNNKPDSVKIGYKTYKVKYVKSIDNPDKFGRIIHTTGVIEVVEDLPDDEILNTLLHEVLHGIFFTYHVLRQEPAQGASKQDCEEDLVRTITNGLMDVIIRNPILMQAFIDSGSTFSACQNAIENNSSESCLTSSQGSALIA